jgi:predicted dehydrogenase
MIAEALKRDINVICEKPVCMKKEEIELVLEAEKASKAQLGVCFQNRYNPSAQYVRELLKDEKLLFANGTMIWKRDENYYAQDAWRGKKATEGGGVLINQAIHTIDMMQWIAGFPESVTAFTENLALRGVIDVEDTANLICRGKNSFTVMATNTGRGDFPTEVVFKTEDKEIRLYSDRVCINGEYIDFKSDAKMYSKSVYGAGHSGLIADFYDCVRSGRRFEIDGLEASKAIRIVLGAYESFGKEIKL